MKKRLLSLLLAFVLAFGFVSPALAEDIYIPVSKVEFRSTVGYGGSLAIIPALVVGNYFNEHVTEYPSLYILKDGALTLLRTLTADNCFCGRIGQTDSDGNAFQYPHISINFTDAEYLAFDFTADYVLKIPAGIYKDETGSPIGQQSVSFSGSLIKEYRNVPTFIGKLYFDLSTYLYSFHKIPFFNTLYMEFDSMMRGLFYKLKIPLIKQPAAG